MLVKMFVIDNCLNLVKKNYPYYSEEKIAEIEYGLLSIYLTISKFIIISIIALLLGIFKEFIIFSIFYNIIRMPSFGLHATKSWICLLSSTLIFIGCPLICKTVTIPINITFILGIICIAFICKNSPADTEKRPIISKERRRRYKILSTVTAIVMVALAIIIDNTFISNCFVLALIVQCLMISPFVYSIFGLPYDNYKKYLTN
jgi:accessory gene regulator B